MLKKKFLIELLRSKISQILSKHPMDRILLPMSCLFFRDPSITKTKNMTLRTQAGCQCCCCHCSSCHCRCRRRRRWSCCCRCCGSCVTPKWPARKCLAWKIVSSLTSYNLNGWAEKKRNRTEPSFWAKSFPFKFFSRNCSACCFKTMTEQVKLSLRAANFVTLQ